MPTDGTTWYILCRAVVGPGGDASPREEEEGGRYVGGAAVVTVLLLLLVEPVAETATQNSGRK